MPRYVSRIGNVAYRRSRQPDTVRLATIAIWIEMLKITGTVSLAGATLARMD